MIEQAIIITGGGKRVGFELAKHLQQQGENVIISYRTFYPELEELAQLGVQLIACNFTQLEDISHFVTQITQRCVSIKALIHNASDWQAENESLNFAELDKLLERMFTIHLKTPYLLNIALHPLLLKYQQETQRTADIIHITDFVTSKGSDKHIAYSASKSAMQNLTLSFAKKYAPEVKVNSISPALIAFNPSDSAEYKQQAQRKSLMQKCGGYAEVINSVNYLLCSQYVTGENLNLTGGRHLK